MAGAIQLDAMRAYRGLVGVRADWGGKLVLMWGPGWEQSGAAPAVCVAGGTALGIDGDGARVKTALRAGRLDFVVNSLDEALRALKNEVRQRRPLSVGLIADVGATLAEMEERGVVADLRMDSAGKEQSGRNGDERFFGARDAARLREIDAALVRVFPAEDGVRRRWVERAPRFMREARAGGRWIWLSAEELAMLAGRGVEPG